MKKIYSILFCSFITISNTVTGEVTKQQPLAAHKKIIPVPIKNNSTASPQKNLLPPPAVTKAKLAVAKMKEEIARKKEGFINIQDPFQSEILPPICSL